MTSAGPAIWTLLSQRKLAVIECELDAEHLAGEHWIAVGRVRRLQLSSGAFAGGFGAFAAPAVTNPCILARCRARRAEISRRSASCSPHEPDLSRLGAQRAS